HRDTREVACARVLTHHIRKVKIEDHLSLVYTTRHHQVCIHDTVVPVDHEVWIDPIVERAVACSDCTGLRFRAGADDRAPLQTMVRAVFDRVVAVVEYAVETLVQIRYVITAVEIVVDKHFPVTVKMIMTPLEPVQIL